MAGKRWQNHILERSFYFVRITVFWLKTSTFLTYLSSVWVKVKAYSKHFRWNSKIWAKKNLKRKPPIIPQRPNYLTSPYPFLPLKNKFVKWAIRLNFIAHANFEEASFKQYLQFFKKSRKTKFLNFTWDKNTVFLCLSQMDLWGWTLPHSPLLPNINENCGFWK
jgi:hypothetical protein